MSMCRIFAAALGLNLCLCCCFFPLSARAQQGGDSPAVQGARQYELLRAPQDMHYFAEKVGTDKLLLTPEEQAKRNNRSDELFFGPWRQSRPSVSAKEFRHMIVRKSRGFLWDKPWKVEDWAALVVNADEGNYPALLGPAVITSHADLRTLPTDEPLFLEPTAERLVDYFDFFQLASLAQGTPVFVAHVSRDKKWLYVEYSLLSGWIRADQVGKVTRDIIKQHTAGPLAVAVKDRLALHDEDGKRVGTAHVGSVFLLASEEGAGKEEKTGKALTVLAPVRLGDGSASFVRVPVAAGTMLPKPLPLTAGALARLGQEMLGQPYSWGGGQENRDCSLATRDLFAPFGIWLPRNSRTQAETKDSVPVAKMTVEAKKAKVLREGRPFLSLLGFPGHVGLYVGEYEGEPVMLHNILGLRTNNAEEDFRHIIGKCILSTLEPGKNMPDLQLEETLLERMRSMRHIP